MEAGLADAHFVAANILEGFQHARECQRAILGQQNAALEGDLLLFKQRSQAAGENRVG